MWLQKLHLYSEHVHGDQLNLAFTQHEAWSGGRCGPQAEARHPWCVSGMGTQGTSVQLLASYGSASWIGVLMEEIFEASCSLRCRLQSKRAFQIPSHLFLCTAVLKLKQVRESTFNPINLLHDCC